MSGGYRKAARALLRLDAADRDWLLEQLAEDDRTRVRDVMVQIGAGEADERTSVPTETAAAPAVEAKAPPRNEGDLELLQRADVTEMQEILADEPDWVVAVVLGHRVWPWGAEFLHGLPPKRVDHLARVAEQVAVNLTPRAKAEILDACAARLHRAEPEPVAPSPFAAMLASLRRTRGMEHSADERGE